MRSWAEEGGGAPVDPSCGVPAPRSTRPAAMPRRGVALAPGGLAWGGPPAEGTSPRRGAQLRLGLAHRALGLAERLARPRRGLGRVRGPSRRLLRAAGGGLGLP